MERDDELRLRLGTLLKTAMVGLGTVREVVVRSTQSGRLRLDIALLQRERAQALEELGELVVRLLEAGDLQDAPEAVRHLGQRVRELEGRIRSDSARAYDNAFGAPRGFEPEAAAEFWDDPEAESDAGPDGAEVEVEPAAASGNGKRRATPRKPRSKSTGAKNSTRQKTKK